uniref:Uncharacterized protein n=1 Tax=Chromera velia CCMP2878 TaxID=1169474 RepID=A0A0G4EZ01_9ALVE|eukprot:Cvel_14204.t1-p1 / transcript=Cvel_14204.t1 / gene=Cvel_14204 / organism=Chromera_velia_CCMP2878 / gene_product=hypothetical protein / transcript_product=hypothetical protein / location=Cvel_scaffold1001:34595-44983(+) / protein_length=792 / sequence_SO=supercontig / SO=protein_coding / is_pseudo=false
MTFDGEAMTAGGEETQETPAVSSRSKAGGPSRRTLSLSASPRMHTSEGEDRERQEKGRDQKKKRKKKRRKQDLSLYFPSSPTSAASPSTELPADGDGKGTKALPPPRVDLNCPRFDHCPGCTVGEDLLAPPKATEFGAWLKYSLAFPHFFVVPPPPATPGQLDAQQLGQSSGTANEAEEGGDAKGAFRTREWKTSVTLAVGPPDSHADGPSERERSLTLGVVEGGTGRVVSLSECPHLHPALREAAKAIGEECVKAGVTPFSAASPGTLPAGGRFSFSSSPNKKRGGKLRGGEGGGAGGEMGMLRKVVLSVDTRNAFPSPPSPSSPTTPTPGTPLREKGKVQASLVWNAENLREAQPFASRLSEALKELIWTDTAVGKRNGEIKEHQAAAPHRLHHREKGKAAQKEGPLLFHSLWICLHETENRNAPIPNAPSRWRCLFGAPAFLSDLGVDGVVFPVPPFLAPRQHPNSDYYREVIVPRVCDLVPPPDPSSDLFDPEANGLEEGRVTGLEGSVLAGRGEVWTESFWDHRKILTGADKGEGADETRKQRLKRKRKQKVVQVNCGLGEVALRLLLRDDVAMAIATDEDEVNGQVLDLCLSECDHKGIREEDKTFIFEELENDGVNQARILEFAETLVATPARNSKQGLGEGLVEALCDDSAEDNIFARHVRTLVYVSRDIPSFQKDAEKLTHDGTWRLDHAEGHVSSPGSNSVEVVARFQRKPPDSNRLNWPSLPREGDTFAVVRDGGAGSSAGESVVPVKTSSKPPSAEEFNRRRRNVGPPLDSKTQSFPKKR